MEEGIEAIQISCKQEDGRMMCEIRDEGYEGFVSDISNLNIEFEAGVDIEISSHPIEIVFTSRHGELFLKKDDDGSAHIVDARARTFRTGYSQRSD